MLRQLNALGWLLQIIYTGIVIHRQLLEKYMLHLINIRKLLVSITILPRVDYCVVVLTDSSSNNDVKLRAVNKSIISIYNLIKDENNTPYRRTLQ